jgi:hypothetical protein
VIIAAVVQHIGSVLFSFTDVALVGFLLLFALGTVSMVFGIMHNTMVLTATPDRVRGRIVGIQILAMGLFPLGSLGLGVLADAIGLQEAVRYVAAGGLVAITLVALAFPELRRPLAGRGGSNVPTQPVQPAPKAVEAPPLAA